jgi:hypothetical protein
LGIRVSEKNQLSTYLILFIAWNKLNEMLNQVFL